MKTARLFLMLALVLLTFGSYQNTSAGAFTYSSAYQVYNLDATQATISIIFYNQDGTIKATIPDTIDGNKSKTYFAVSQLTGTFNGSIVISSTTRLASIVNVHGQVGTNMYYANASYIAATSGASPVQIPLLQKGNSGYNTWFAVQNTGSSAATVNVAYSDGTSVNGVSIPPFSSHTYDQATETHPLKVFAATVTSTQPVAVTVIEETTTLLFAYNGFPASTTNPVLPLVQAYNSGIDSGVAIKNDGGSSTDVTLSYTPLPGNGTACAETQTIAAGAMKTFALAAFTNGAFSNCIPLAKFVGSAKVTTNTASQPLTVVVNQHKRPINGSAYDGFDSNAATNTVIFPLIMDRNSGFWTGFNVMNVGTQPTNVACTFTNTGVNVPSTLLQPGGALNHLQLNAIASGYVGSGTCTATGGDAKIVGVVNETRQGYSTDTFLTYEGINITTP